MDLIDRLRPRWRHPDPEVRASAVREMGEADHERLGTIATTDPDARVRRIAIKKLADPDILERLAVSEGDPGLRELATERARELLVAIAGSSRPLAECEAALSRFADERSLAAVAIAATHEGIRRAALARASGDRLLRDVVRSAADPAIRREALDRIHDVAVLRSIAVGDGPPEVALLAVERIDDAETLRAIAESQVASKSVRQRARTLLPAGSAARTPVGFKEGRARQLALSTVVAALAAEPDVMLAAERVREAEREWRDLARDVEPRDDVAARFTTACQDILEGAASLARRRAEVDHARVALTDGLAARSALCERIEALDGADAPRDLAVARAEWTRLAPVGDEHVAALSRRFTLAGEECVARHERWRTHERLRAGVVALLEEAEALADSSPLPPPRIWDAIEKRWAASIPPKAVAAGDATVQQRFASARVRLQQRWQEAAAHRSELRQENLTRLERLWTRLREIATSEALKASAARRELQAADAALTDLGPLPPSERRAAWTERLSEARDQLLRRVRRDEEAEEWRRWGNVGAQEEIIRRVEALLESNDLAEGTRVLGRLQDEWAGVATATPDKSQALWERFRTARNALHKRCDAYLAENLEKKRALCAQAAGFGDSTTWNETTKLIKALQAEWKQIGPVPAKYTSALWMEFREPCDRFFTRRKEHFERVDGERRENAHRKTALCEQAEALADSTDWETTATAIKQLQAEWKRTGAAPHARGEVLWQRFRAACDRFFDRRSRREEVAREETLRRARAICEELEALASSPEPIGQKIDEAWGAWTRLDLGAFDEARVLNERLHAACEQIVLAQPESLRGTRLDPEATRKRREKLCTRLEELLGTASEPPRELSLQEMALALRERLAANTIAGPAGRRTGRQDTAREVERISASWAQLGPVLGGDARALADRFERLRARVPAESK
ncbi:MAG: DUF349 domain-containing protein [Candidatus Binatia bacterium]